jgi:ADP-ribose pyrophosphatase YjhB (NUDIX family)
MWVFPGGQVDEADAADDEREAARRAAVREAKEEAGLDLDPGSLVVRAWWLPPPEAARRFATWFFLAPAPPGEVVVDGTEIFEHRWVSPAAAHAARDREEMTLAPPTWMTVWWLGHYADRASALAAARRAPVERFETRMARHDKDLVALWAGDAGYADGDPAATGARRRLVMAGEGWRAEVDGGSGSGGPLAASD